MERSFAMPPLLRARAAISLPARPAFTGGPAAAWTRTSSGRQIAFRARRSGLDDSAVTTYAASSMFRCLRYWFDSVDTRITRWMAGYGITFLRIALGLVFVWFGALKLVPGLSPAEDLVRATVPIIPGGVFMPVLGVWEITIGLGFLTARALRLTILLLFLQMPGTLSPVVLLPERVFTAFPFGLTLEGQYIFKNLVLISAALVIGATVRGGRLVESASEGSAGAPAGPRNERSAGPRSPAGQGAWR
jgi:uncharacterized membrane protein YkgB